MNSRHIFPAKQGAAPPGVTVSRGSDVMLGVPRKTSVVMPETEELKFEEAEELDEEEMKEVIIYLPPSQDDFDSEVARSETYPIYVLSVVLDPYGAGTRYTLKDLPQDVPGKMRLTCNGPENPLHTYSIWEFSCSAEKHFLFRAPREMEPCIGSFTEGDVAKSFCPWEEKFPSANLLRLSASPEQGKQDKQLITKNTNEYFSVKSSLTQANKPDINLTLNKECLKFKPSADDNVNLKNNKVENKHPSKNKRSEFCQNSKKNAWLCDLFNKKTGFGGLVLFTITLLGYYNFVWVH